MIATAPATPVPASASWIRLDRLTKRCCATVRAIDTDDEDSQRLKTLGLCVGRQVEVIQTGNPLIVRVFSSRIGLSAELAARLQVETCASGCACPILPPAEQRP
jgi:Fe2+ transport system protein FeoA